MTFNIQRANYRFHGGIHPPECKALSNQQPLMMAGLPEQVVLHLGQRLDRLATPVVKPGDRVKRGQLLATSESPASACVHASISGEVLAIEPHPLPHPSGLSLPALVLVSDGLDEPEESVAYPDWPERTADELLPLIYSSGLAGLGGAVFPTRTKLAGALSKGIDTLIINAAECEPYITADDVLMRTRPQAILEGIGLLKKLLQPKQLLLGIEDNKPEALAALQEALPASGLEKDLQLLVVPTLYPSGGEKQLIQLLTGKEVPSGGLPLDLGILCHNVGTLAALADAVVRGQPLIERVVTLTGQALARPGNFRIRIGTPMSQLLDEAGLDAQKAQRLIMGGPMMGFTLPDTQLPITKAVNCLLVPTQQELPLPGPEQPCIRCGRCEEVCPAQLLPQQLYYYAAGQAFEKAEDQQLFDCIECGACAWVCPSEIPLVHYYRYAKDEIRQQRDAAEKAEQARLRFEARQERLEREAAEKEAKRKARAAAAAQANAAKKQAEQQKAAASTQDKTTSTPDESAASQAKKLKQLKVARAAATVAVKKAEKGLSNLESSADATAEQIQEQQTRLQAAREQLKIAEAKLGEAEGN
ncbi:electron transport complex protein RnfC [Marinospirillum celere]|uniref:Ion-translocating oxidoreductase complex subunit C n=1 Tax=Marinospirillum celere TaxID=1122252 RepID=A0A1I1EI83_9GAMM|nr:electron transport complex subunit RsxC [Marinospirillum celere]SFB84653.1 electron transport complex protein RnfC [Marinospirillum celere]